MYKKILVPLDGSTLAESILPYAKSLAKTEQAQIILLRVALTPDENFRARNTDLTEEAVKEIRNEAESYAKRTSLKLNLQGVNTLGIVRDGPVPETILNVAQEINVDMIAMATHGRIGIKRWLFGSVAEQVVHNSAIPVLLIHPN